MYKLAFLLFLLPSISFGEVTSDHPELVISGCPDINTIQAYVREDPTTGEPLIVLDMDNYRRLQDYILCAASKAQCK